MLLGVDIGNTNINFAIFGEGGRILKRFKTPTKNTDLLPALGKIKKKNVDKIIIVSVVPEALRRIEAYLRRSFKGVGLYVVGRDIKIPLKCLYDKREIGQDRLITAFAAKSIYGLPILIVDFGTAVTLDVVSERNEYIGGLILPGIKMSLESLYERAAMLPLVYLRRINFFIGKDTASSIRGGMIYGYCSMCEGLINLFRKKIAKRIKIVATGGDAALIARYAPSLKTVDKDLSLKGLYLVSKLKI